ncbi:MAG: hypothetical protein AAB602_02710 [Patescibacteria group bacterium]
MLLLVVFGLRFFGNIPVGTETVSTSTIATSSDGTAPVTDKSSVVPKKQVPTPISEPTPEEQQPEEQTPQQLNIDPAQIPDGFSVNQLSPYFRRVIFSGVSFPGDITLSLAYDIMSPINITGWLIQARRGGQVIPQAINIYDPTGLVPETDIYLRPGDVLRMFPYASTIGKNFRLNKCIGALENENHFTPSLPWYCPALYKNYSEISSFTGKCQDYISSLNYCTAPDFYSVDIPYDDYACQAYLQNTINFKGCFDKYRGDTDFLTNEIWAWTGNDRLLDERHDRVLLFDRTGLLVDEYSY